MEAVAERFIQAYFEDMARLNIKEADAYPRATHTRMGLSGWCTSWNKGAQRRGDVYYAVRKLEYVYVFPRKLEDLQAGASGQVPAGVSLPQRRLTSMSDLALPQALDPEAHKKKDPFDFAL